MFLRVSVHVSVRVCMCVVRACVRVMNVPVLVNGWNENGDTESDQNGQQTAYGNMA